MQFEVDKTPFSLNKKAASKVSSYGRFFRNLQQNVDLNIYVVHTFKSCLVDSEGPRQN